MEMQDNYYQYLMGIINMQRITTESALKIIGGAAECKLGYYTKNVTTDNPLCIEVSTCQETVGKYGVATQEVVTERYVEFSHCAF